MNRNYLRIIMLLIVFTIFFFLLSIYSEQELKVIDYPDDVNGLQILRDDVNNITNPHDFQYMLNPEFEICGVNSGRNVTLMAIVPISADSFSRRFIIRSTWGSKNMYPNEFKYVFLVGNTYDKAVNEKIR